MTVTIGLIGFGARAGLWKTIQQQGGEIAVVCDIDPASRAKARELLPGAQVVETLEEVLAAGVDAVFLTTPDDAHAAPAIAAMRAGVAVFCEKPMAITVEDADAMLGTAYETGSRLYIGHNMRHMPVVTQMRQLILDGEIGEVEAIWCRHFVGNGGDYYFKDWHADRSHTTGLLLQKGAHDIDVMHWLAGGFTRRVSAMGALKIYGDITDRRDRSGERMGDWFSIDNWPPESLTGLNPTVDVEDISMMLMQLDNGVLASYQQCHFAPDYWRNYTVIGSRGRIENFGDSPGDTIGLWNRRHGGHAEPDQVFTIGSGAGGGHGGADPSLVGEFLRFVAEGGITQTSPVAARESVAAGVLATQSLRGRGEAIDVPPLPQEWIDYFERGQVRA